MKDPLLLPVGALGVGVLCSRLVPFHAGELLVALSCLLGLTLVAHWRSKRLVILCTFVTVICLGILLEVLHRRGRAPSVDAGPRELVVLNGCVVSPPQFYEGRDQFVLELARHARARVTLTIRDGETPPELQYGQLIEVEGYIRPVRNFHNPGGFDYEAFAARRDVYWTATVPAGIPVQVKPGRCGSLWRAAVFGLRTAALRRIDRLYANNAYATGMMEATLIGETTKLERLWTDHFRRTGTYHMLVIDGLHITVLAAFLLLLLRLCFLPELWALAVTAAGAWLYALVSGGNAPAVRAAGGFTLYLIARFFYRRGRLLNLLAAAAIIYLVCDPGQLFDAGFQMSFLAVAVIGAFAVPVLEATSVPYARALRGLTEPSRDPRMPPRAAQFRLELRLLAETMHYYSGIPQDWLSAALVLVARVVFYAYELAVISAAIQIGVVLPMAFYFHFVSLTGVSANVFVVPLLALVVPLGFLAVFTGLQMPAQLAGLLLTAGDKLAGWHLRFEPDWRVANPPLWLALAFSAVLIALAWAMQHSRTLSWCSTAAMLALFFLIFRHPFPPAVHPGELELTAIDVGQGDSLLIAFPDSKLMLVDAGGVLSFGRRVKPRLDIGEDVVSPYLWSRSITKIDVVAMTHAHDDHAQGLPAILENFHPSELWTGATAPSEAWSAVEAKARAEKIKTLRLRSGLSFDFAGTHIDFLAPPRDYKAGNAPANNDSLVMRITYKQRSLMLTGDIEKPIEQRILAEGRPLHADVLKVCHHGSNTSSTEPFLAAVSPAFAVISDGLENPFHHPHPKVLERLAEHRAAILRTDLDGLITVRTDGWRISVETYRMGAAPHSTYPFSGFDF